MKPIKFILSCIGKTGDFFHKIRKKISAEIKKARFAECGKDVTVAGRTSFVYKNMHVGDHVSIGSNSMYLCTKARIIIGDHVMIGAYTKVITGSHITDIQGRYMDEITNAEKRPGDDEDIVFEGDNWVGVGCIILKGVTIGRGAVIGAGSIVTKDIPPYSISVGVPAKPVKYRFTPEEIESHEKALYGKVITKQ